MQISCKLYLRKSSKKLSSFYLTPVVRAQECWQILQETRKWSKPMAKKLGKAKALKIFAVEVTAN